LLFIILSIALRGWTFYLSARSAPSVFHLSFCSPTARDGLPINTSICFFRIAPVSGFRFFSLFGCYFWPPLALILPTSAGAHSAFGHAFPLAISPLQIYSFLSFFSIPSTLFSPRAAFLSLFL